jgi:hypothetical protein
MYATGQIGISKGEASVPYKTKAFEIMLEGFFNPLGELGL